jgi:rhodanese-related sulfurtransferase
MRTHRTGASEAMRIDWSAAILLAVTMCSSCRSDLPPAVREAKARIREITPPVLKSWNDSGQKPLLIDVREDDEWQARHAAGALHIARWTLADRIGATAPDKATRIVLYCQGGVRSALAADRLQNLGYTNVFSLAGGFKAYQLAKLPVEK